MLDADIKIKLQRLIKEDGFFRKKLESGLDDVADLVVLPAYKKQMPVDKGTGRQNAQTIIVNPLHRKVTSTANVRGFYYLNAVHQGTGKYRGAGDFGFIKPGYTRVNGYSDADKKRFAGMAKRGVKFSIKPNKFADRTFQETETPAVRFLYNHLRQLINESR